MTLVLNEQILLLPQISSDVFKYTISLYNLVVTKISVTYMIFKILFIVFNCE